MSADQSPRERRGLPGLEAVGRDLRHSVRLLARAPGFAAVVVLSLAVGIGGNSAIFSVLNALTFRALPLPQPQQLARLTTQGDNSTPASEQQSYPFYQRLLPQVPAGAGVCALSRVARVSGRVDGSPDAAPTGLQLVSGECFATLGLTPFLGRFLGPEDNRVVGGHPVGVLSHGFWQRRLQSALDVLGRTVSLNGARFTVVGVAPPGFAGVWLESPTDVFVPLVMQAVVHYKQNFSSFDADDRPWPLQDRIRWLDIIVRAGDQRRPQTLAALQQVHAQQLAVEAEKIDDTDRRRMLLARRVSLEPFDRGFSSLRGRFLSPLLVLMSMMGLLLLIACANTANLLLARAARRRREIALRLSVGATRGRVVQQLGTESLLLGLLGGGLALLLAPWIAQLLLRMITGNFFGPLPFAVTPDWRVFLFTALVALVTSLLFGLTPALRSTRLQIGHALRSGGRGTQGGPGSRPAKFLVVAQVALSLLLVVVAGLFLRSLRSLMTVELGFAREHLISVVHDSRAAGYQADDLPALHRRLIERAEALPGVRSATVAECALVANCRSTSTQNDVSGYQRRPGESISIQTNEVGPNYFQTVGMPIIAGRDFDSQDHQKLRPVAIVNEAFVRRYFAGRSAIGQRYGGGTPHIEIVGVVKDARTTTVREAAVPTAFHPGASSGILEVRTTGDPTLMVATLRRALTESEPRLVIDRVRTLSEQVDRNLSQEKAVASLTLVLGLLALGLACFGLYGLMSYAVAGRTAELGVRTALGAPPSRLLWMVLGESLRLVLFGLLAGLALVLVAARFLAGQLFGVGPTDPTTVIGSALVLVLVAAVAAYLPARRASRVDPLVALRSE